MSDDESPTTGGLQANTAEYDSNNSIIGKVKSRVSSILPQTLSKWFSPSSKENSHNGSLRRRRDESEEQGENTDDTDYSGAEDDGRIAPPAKRSRLSIEQYSTETDRHGRNVNQRLNTDLLSSSLTPTTRNCRKYQQQQQQQLLQNRKSGNLKLSSNDRRDSSCSFENATSSTLISQRISERNSQITGESRVPNETIIIAEEEEEEEEDEAEAEEDDDVGELRSINLISNRRNIIWDNENISSRRTLNIPLSSNTTMSHYPNLRRQSLRNIRTLTENEAHHHHNPDSHKVEEQEIETNDDESEDVDNSVKFGDNSSKTSNTKKGHLINGGIQREEGSSSIVVQVDTASESGDSQCSSFQRPKQMSSGSLNPIGIGKSLRNSSIGNGLNFYMNLEGKKSLFSQKNMPNLLNNSTLSLTSLNRRQSFNSSLYGSTSALSDSRLLNITSPFYKGRTTYGGASAYSKYTPQMQRTLHAPVLMRPTSSLSTLSSSSNSLAGQYGAGECSSSTSPAISNTAKRILELMNQFTTPLNDAKKMVGNIKGPPLTPHRRRFGSETDLTTNRGIRLSTPQTPYSRPTVDRQQYVGPANKELQVPSMSQLLQMKKLQSNTEKVREIANSSKSILNQEKEYKLPTESQNLDSVDALSSGNNNKSVTNTKHISKIKNKVTSTRTSSRNILAERETMPEVNLPEIALPFMKSVPKIDISISKPQISTSSIITSPQKGSSEKLKSGFSFCSGNGGNEGPFTTNNTSIFGNNKMNYTSPSSSISNASQNNSEVNRKVLARLPTLTEFTFSEPIAISSTIEGITKQQDSTGNSYKFSEPIIVNNAECKSLENFKYQPPEKSAEKETLNFGAGGSINNSNNDKFNNSNSASSNSNRQNVPQLKTTGSVLDALKTPIKTLSKENTGTSNSNIATTPVASSGFGDIFKMSGEKWECPTCMIRNCNSKDNCEACETPRPKSLTGNKTQAASLLSSSSSVVPTIPITNSLQNQFKANPNTWECPTCMIRNQNELNECAACNTNRPGSKAAGLQTSSTFTVPKSCGNTSFASASSIKPTVMDTGFKNIAAQQSSKWECPVCMTRNEQNKTKCVCCEQPKPGSLNENAPSFSFGTPSSKFTFGFTNKKEDDLKKEDENKSGTSSDSSIKKDIGSPKTGFQFGISTSNTISSTSASTVPIAVKSTSSSFSFGFKPVDNTGKNTDVPDTKDSGFKFGNLPQGGGEKADESKNINKGFTFGSNISSTSQSNDNKQTDKGGESSVSNVTTSSGLSFGQTNVMQKSSPISATSSNVLKPAGGFGFGNPSDKMNPSSASKNPTEVPSSSNPPAAVNAIFGAISSSNVNASSEKSNFTFGSPSSLSKSETAASGKPNFQFGSNFSKDNSEKAETKKPLFNFGSSDVQKQQATVPLFGSSNISTFQKGDAVSTANTGKPLFSDAKTISTTSGISSIPSAVTAASAPTFMFGKTSAPASNSSSIFGNVNNNASAGSGNAAPSGEPKFGSFSQNSTTQSSSLLPSSTPTLSNNNTLTVTSTSTMPTFGSSSLIKATSNLPIGNQGSSTTFGNLVQSQNTNNGQNSFGSSNFTNLANNNALQVANNANSLSNNQPTTNLFSFGAAATNVAKTESSSSFGNTSGTVAAKPFTFGPAASASPSPSTTFVFGNPSNVPKPAEGTSIFGSVGNTASSTTGTLPSFGSFGNSSQQQQQQPQNTSTTFGQPVGGGINIGTGLSGGASGTASIFGTSNLNQAASPAFGSQTNSGGGNNTIFGSSSNFGTPTFGGSQTNPPSFGSSTAAPIPGFGSTFSSAEGPAAKRQDMSGGFNFGQAAQNPSGQFSFGASTNNNNNTAKTPFSFPEPTTKSFNFTGNQETAPNAPFQFSSPANNIFAPTPTPGSGSSAAMARRKARTAPRRVPR